jgi:septum formation protein
MKRAQIILASASPRRRELLAQIGVEHRVLPVEVDESWHPGEDPSAYVLRVAEAKARAGWLGAGGAGQALPVLAADTTVALDGEVFGKPQDRDALRTMLGRLGGRTHEVHTAVALMSRDGLDTRLSSTRVSLRPVSLQEIDWYWDTGEPADKAGGYAIQGLAALFVSHIAGSYSGVVGLPIFETWELLEPVLGPSGGGPHP